MSRKTRRVERLEFTPDEPGEVVDHMRALASARGGWINLRPKTSDEDRPTSLGFSALFNGSSTGLTMCTWVPETEVRRGQRPPSLGITHATGRRLVPQLAPLLVPDHWTIEQDHPRRGLVLRIPAHEPPEPILDWALKAIGALDRRGLIGRWRAEIYFPPNS